MVAMNLGERSNAVRRKELALVQHILQDLAELILGRNGKQAALTHARRPHAGHIADEVRPIVDEPLQPPFEARQPLQQLRLQGFHGEQRNQPDHGTNLHWKMRAVRQPQHVVEEAVLLVPQSRAILAAMAHRMRDVDEVLPEFARHVFVGPVFLGQLERNGQEIERVHGHPARAVGLFDVATGGQRGAPIEHADVV